MTKRPTPNETYAVVKPNFEGALELFERLTGRKVAPEELAQLALEFAGTPVMGGEAPPQSTRH